MKHFLTRREILRKLGIGSAALPLVWNLPSLCDGAPPPRTRKRRLVIMFSPNGVIPQTFWPDKEGELQSFKPSLEPLEPFRKKTLILHGVCDKIRGDGDNHMRGIGCLLTGVELLPGNIQGGSDTPAGWANGRSIDQEITNHLQSDPATHTRFGSLEFGVLVPNRADTWTRMVYAAANRPLAPISNPYQMFNRLYGRVKDRESLKSVLDDLQDELKSVSRRLSAEDRQLLAEHATFVREMEQDLRGPQSAADEHAVPPLEQGVKEDNDQMPRLTRLQIDLMINAFRGDFARVATLQLTNSVGQARMHWLDIPEDHHDLSHRPDNDKSAVDKLTRINRWYCEQLAYLAKRLAETPEPGGSSAGGGNMLDNTLIVWTNELGKGNSHTLDDIPWVLVGGGLDYHMGRSLKFHNVPHNRLLMALAHGMGHEIKTFGNSNYCKDGALTGLV
jgi:hypothetical protein